MHTSVAIETRRAVKHYDPEHRLTEEEIQKLFSLALLSPTSFNIQNWRFLAVTDPERRQQLRAAAWDQAQVTDASLLVVVCADLKSWEKDPARYWNNAPQPVQDFMVPAIGDFYRGNDPLQRDEAMRSCGIAAQTLMLAATEMGYASCPMIGFDPEKVAELVHLPDDHVIGLLVVIGKGTKDAWPRGGQLPLDEVLFRDRFGG
ncbi:MAG: nitroreductase family protein [Opitutales bacterium]